MTTIEVGDSLTLACARVGEPYELTGPRGRIAEFLDLGSPDHHDLQLEDAQEPWRMQAYGRGWRLAVTRRDTNEPVAWYTGNRIRAGGELLVAPERDYRVTSRRLKALDWKLHEEDELLDVTGKPLKGSRVQFEIDVTGAPSHAADLPVVVCVLAMVAYVSWEDAHAFRGSAWTDGG